MTEKEKEVSRDDALKVLQNDEQQRREACAEEIKQVLAKHGFKGIEVEHSVRIT